MVIDRNVKQVIANNFSKIQSIFENLDVSTPGFYRVKESILIDFDTRMDEGDIVYISGNLYYKDIEKEQSIYVKMILKDIELEYRIDIPELYNILGNPDLTVVEAKNLCGYYLIEAFRPFVAYENNGKLLDQVYLDTKESIDKSEEIIKKHRTKKAIRLTALMVSTEFIPLTVLYLYFPLLGDKRLAIVLIAALVTMSIVIPLVFKPKLTEQEREKILADAQLDVDKHIWEAVKKQVKQINSHRTGG